MTYRILGLDPTPFQPLFGLPDADLARHGAIRMRVDERHAYPDRIEVRDAEPGEHVLLLNHAYLDVDNPYRGTHAIFVREGATRALDVRDTVPDALRRRLLSVRAFDAASMMVDAEVVQGTELEPLVERFFANPAVHFLQVHHARRGCYAARIER